MDRNELKVLLDIRFIHSSFDHFFFPSSCIRLSSFPPSFLPLCERSSKQEREGGRESPPVTSIQSGQVDEVAWLMSLNLSLSLSLSVCVCVCVSDQEWRGLEKERVRFTSLAARAFIRIGGQKERKEETNKQTNAPHLLAEEAREGWQIPCCRNLGDSRVCVPI